MGSGAEDKGASSMGSCRRTAGGSRLGSLLKSRETLAADTSSRDGRSWSAQRVATGKWGSELGCAVRAASVRLASSGIALTDLIPQLRAAPHLGLPLVDFPGRTPAPAAGAGFPQRPLAASAGPADLGRAEGTTAFAASKWRSENVNLLGGYPGPL